MAAFVSGAPGGREVEPVRYGRTLVGGLVLAVLLVAGAAVMGLLKPTVPNDWKERGLIIGKESGARFLAAEGQLFPIANTTSARLLLAEDGKLKVTFVPDDLIAREVPGQMIGIPGAPDVLPKPDELVQTGWTACIGPEQRTKLRIASRPAATISEHGAMVVEARKSVYVVTSVVRKGARRTYRYELPAAHHDAVRRALALDGVTVRPVPGVWLDLIPLGDPLAPFEVEGSGRRTDEGPPGVDRIGTPVRVGDRGYVLTQDGLAALDEFAYAVYVAGGTGAQLGEHELDAADLAGVKTAEPNPGPVTWPMEPVTPYDGEGSGCLLLQAEEDKAPIVHLATATDDAAVYDEDEATTVEVERGRGALVRATSGGAIARGTEYLVDNSGIRYAVGAKGEEKATRERLGYAEVKPMPVPLSWMDLFADGHEGPELTMDAAEPQGARG